MVSMWQLAFRHRPTGEAGDSSPAGPVAAAAALLLTLVASGCSTSPGNDESTGSVEQPTTTTETAPGVEPSLAIGPDGWLLHTSTRLGVDLRVLAPADIGESAQDIRFGVPESQGLNVEWKTEQQEPDESNFSRFVTWEELGIDEDTYLHYGIAEYLINPRTPSWLTSGEVWSAHWGQEPIRVELPEVIGAAWWTVVGTDAGYVGLPRLAEGDWHAQWILATIDGVDWLVMEDPAPSDLRMIIDGNAMVATDRQGNVRRFPIP